MWNRLASVRCNRDIPSPRQLFAPGEGRRSLSRRIHLPNNLAEAAVADPPTILNAGYRSTNFWVISAGANRFLLDLGWPGSMGMFRAQLQRMDVPLKEIRYGLATHYHPDHAGLAQELKLAGVPLVVIDLQESAIPQLKQWMKPADKFVDISLHDNVVISCAESRALLARIGIAGEIVHTPGHSEHCVSLLLDDDSVFTGDLTFPEFFGDDNRDTALASWRLLREKGATRIYPGHGSMRLMEAMGIG